MHGCISEMHICAPYACSVHEGQEGVITSVTGVTDNYALLLHAGN